MRKEHGDREVAEDTKVCPRVESADTHGMSILHHFSSLVHIRYMAMSPKRWHYCETTNIGTRPVYIHYAIQIRRLGSPGIVPEIDRVRTAHKEPYGLGQGLHPVELHIWYTSLYSNMYQIDRFNFTDP
jgi:hypothetical protein